MPLNFAGRCCFSIKHFFAMLAKFGPGCGLVACLTAQVAMFKNLNGDAAVLSSATNVLEDAIPGVRITLKAREVATGAAPVEAAPGVLVGVELIGQLERIPVGHRTEELDVAGDLAIPILDQQHSLGLLPEAVLGELSAEGRLRHDPEGEIHSAITDVRVSVVQGVQVRLADLAEGYPLSFAGGASVLNVGVVTKYGFNSRQASRSPHLSSGMTCSCAAIWKTESADVYTIQAPVRACSAAKRSSTPVPLPAQFPIFSLLSGIALMLRISLTLKIVHQAQIGNSGERNHDGNQYQTA